MSDDQLKGPEPNVINDPERNAWMAKFALEYMQRHPAASVRYTKRQARQRWRSKQKREGKV